MGIDGMTRREVSMQILISKTEDSPKLLFVKCSLIIAVNVEFPKPFVAWRYFDVSLQSVIISGHSL